MDAESAIRRVIKTWMESTKCGDSEAVLRLMDEDVVFMVLGRESSGKSEFAKMGSAQAAGSMEIDVSSEIEEVQVVGDWAFARSKLRVTVTQAGKSSIRSGHTLSVFVRKSGAWLLSRDANLLVPDETNRS